MNEKIFQMKQLSTTLPKSLKLQFQMCGTTYPSKSYVMNRSLASVCCVAYIISGAGHIQVGNVTFDPKAGDTFLLPQGMEHHYRSDQKNPWKMVWLNFSGQMASEMIRQYGIEGRYHFPSLDISDLLLKLQYYTAQVDLQDRGERCVSILSSIFYRLSMAQEPKKDELPRPVHAMLSYIERHETDMITLEKLAAVCQKSPSQAERIFKKELGIPPYRYILNRKIELAQQLLRETGMSVRDISAYLSFSDEFYFSGLFRKKTGYSPTQYRQSRQDEDPEQV